MTKVFSEGIVFDFVFLDVDSVFLDRSEFSVFEFFFILSVSIFRDIIYSDIITDVFMVAGDITMEEVMGRKDSDGEMCGFEYCFFVVEYNYGDKGF